MMKRIETNHEHVFDAKDKEFNFLSTIIVAVLLLIFLSSSVYIMIAGG